MAPIAIPLSRTKLIAVLMGSLVFVGAGVWMFLLPPIEPTEGKLVGVAAILFFGFAMIVAGRRLFDVEPGLVLDAEGIIDNSSGVGVGRIPWGDITGVKVTKRSGQRFLTIELADPHKYVARGGRLKRLANAANLELVGSPVNISSTALRIGFDELDRLVTEALRAPKS
jgi:hypothetical protein